MLTCRNVIIVLGTNEHPHEQLLTYLRIYRTYWIFASHSPVYENNNPSRSTFYYKTEIVRVGIAEYVIMH